MHDMVKEQDPAKWDKREKIVYLLDKWQDIFSPTMGSSLAGGVHGQAGSRSPGRLSGMHNHESVKQLEYALRLLNAVAPVHFKHLRAYRCNAEWRTTDAVRRVKLPSGKWDIVPDRISLRVVPKWIDKQKVMEGEVLLVKLFKGDVFIPDELWNALTKAA